MSFGKRENLRAHRVVSAIWRRTEERREKWPAQAAVNYMSDGMPSFGTPEQRGKPVVS